MRLMRSSEINGILGVSIGIAHVECDLAACKTLASEQQSKQGQNESSSTRFIAFELVRPVAFLLLTAIPLFCAPIA